MENRKWFILQEGQVLGPYEKTDLDSIIPKMPNALIWGRGHSEWSTPEKWKHILLEEEASQRLQQQNERFWKVKIGEQEFKPVTYQRMIDFLRTKNDLSDVRIWTEGYSEWKEIYQIHKIMDELGVSRRAHPRVPIMGTLLCEGLRGGFTAHVLSISEGGLGITEAPQVRIGDKIKILMKSPNLYAPIHASAEVVFVGTDGYAGLKFIGLHSESKSMIIEYVNKYSQGLTAQSST